jgi:Major capsid protein 13-like
MASNSLDIYLASGTTFTAANYLTATTFIDAKQRLGDAKESLTAIIMHSAVEAALEKLNLIVYIPQAEQGTLIKTFGGKRVIIDDTMTVEVINTFNVYSTFLFGAGAIAYGVGTMNKPVRGSAPNSTWGLEFAREALEGQNIMIQRRRFILHPRGVKWTGASMAGLSPTNAELANQANWTRVFESKNVRMVRIRHNIDMS